MIKETVVAKGGFDVDQLLDGVEIKNRIVDGVVKLLFDGRPVEFAPGEVKRTARKVAEFLRDKSLFCFNPGDYNDGIPPTYMRKLCILNNGEDESDLYREDVAKVRELLDVNNMPQLARVDPATGLPMRRVYIDPRSTGAMGTSDSQHTKEKQVVKETSSAIIADAAGKIVDAVKQTGVSEADIAVAVKTVAKEAAGPANA